MASPSPSPSQSPSPSVSPGCSSFRASLVSCSSGGSSVPLRTDGNTIFGRGTCFGISDRRVSRRHGELQVSSQSKSVTIRPLSVNPSYVERQGERVPLVKDALVELNHGDKLCLLDGLCCFTLVIEDDGESQWEEPGEDATQLDLDALEDFERASTRAAVKRSREEVSSDPEGHNKNNLKKSRRVPSQSGVLINPEELKFAKTIGLGSCGEVYEADWRGTRVAVKKIFRTLLHQDTLKEFQMETDILRHLRHPNIVLFMGTCMQGREMCIVTEYIERGSLRQVLGDSSLQFEPNTLLSMAKDAARGMNYLHSYNPPIIHRDLKSHNLLVDRNYGVKVTDFGLAKFQVDDIATTFCGTLPWTAPEVFSGIGYSEKADVYSFGIVLWELLTRLEPYNGMNKAQIIVGVTRDHLRPSKPEAGSPAYKQLMQDCWGEDPLSRPSFSEILHRLDLVQSSDSVKRQDSSSMEIATPMNLTEQFQNFQTNVTQKWEIDPKELEFISEIGEGTASITYKGKFRDQLVAIKVLKETLDEKHKEDFTKELEILSSFRSPHVVTFYGACSKPHLAIVTELLSNGNLNDILSDTKLYIDWGIVIKLCCGVATAVNTLHSHQPPILHRDIKPQNFLVDKDWGVKVTDFGLARFRPDSNEDNASITKLRGTYLYAAPETYKGEAFSTKSDVFSFGITMWEVVTRCITAGHRKPYSEHKHLKFDFQVIIQTAKKNLRPVVHSSCPPPFAELMQACWHPEPSQRPSFEQILTSLHNIQSLFQEERAKQQLEKQQVQRGEGVQ